MYIYIYASNLGAPIFKANMNRTEWRNIQYNKNKGLQYPTFTLDGSLRQKTNKETVDLISAIDRMDLMHIYGTFSPPAPEYTWNILILECTWNLIQDSSYVRPQSKS